MEIVWSGAGRSAVRRCRAAHFPAAVQFFIARTVWRNSEERSRKADPCTDAHRAAAANSRSRLVASKSFSKSSGTLIPFSSSR